MDEQDQQHHHQESSSEVNQRQQQEGKKKINWPPILGGAIIVIGVLSIYLFSGGTNLSGTWSINESNGSGVGNGSGTSTLIVSQGGNGVLSGQFVPSGDTADTMPISGNFDASTNKFVFSGPLDAESFSGTYQNGELVGTNSSAAGVQSNFTATK